ncbi:MAG: hypothetical protein PHX38_00780 [Sulfuricella sp.]|nr:hypothetical protein [Sulfuricella sp.]
MKKRRPRASRKLAGAADYFVRGFVATGLLAALQDPSSRGAPHVRAVLRHALQGGAALAAGGIAADALREGSPAGALTAVGAGVAALAMIAHFTHETHEPKNLI